MRWAVALTMASLAAQACGGKTDDPGVARQSPSDDPRGSGGVAGSGYRPPLNDGCFGAGTRIATATGSLAIEDVRVGDRVQAFDFATRMIVDKPVTEVFVHFDKTVGQLHTAFGSLRVTANHPIYDASQRRFVPAGSLSDSFQSLELVSNWSTARAPLSGFEPLAEPETVYNLTVADLHTYFADGVLVHNKPRCGYPGDPPDCPCVGDECPPLVTPGTGGSGGSGGTGGVGGMSDAGGAGGTSSAGGLATSGSGGFGGVGGAGGAPSSSEAGAAGAAGAVGEP